MAGTTELRVTPGRLLTLIEAEDRAPAVAAGLRDYALFAPAGQYQRLAPTYLDLDEAAPQTRARILATTSVVQQHYPDIYLACLHGALLTGQGSVVTRDGTLLYESAAEFLAHDRVPDDMARAADGSFRFTHDISMEILTPCLLVKRPWYRNFGHWLVDCATILGTVAQIPAAADWPIVIGSGFDPATKQIVHETLLTFRPDASILEHRDSSTWRFADLRYVMPLHTPPQFKLPAALGRLRERFAGGIAPERGRRIFVPRRDAPTRRLANHAQVEDVLLRHGFESVTLVGMTLAQQAQLFASAEAVVGVKGAALTNLLFCSPGACVLVLTPGDFSDPFFWDIAAQRGMRYGELAGAVTTDQPDGFNDFAIDPARLTRALAALLPAQQTAGAFLD